MNLSSLPLNHVLSNLKAAPLLIVTPFQCLKQFPEFKRSISLPPSISHVLTRRKLPQKTILPPTKKPLHLPIQGLFKEMTSPYWFIDIKNSSLEKVPRMFCSSSSMASCEFISAKWLRRMYIFLRMSLSSSKSSRRVLEAVTSMAG